MRTVYCNCFNIQVVDTVRIVFLDARQGVTSQREPNVVEEIVANVVLSHENARALRDHLVANVKDPPPPAPIIIEPQGHAMTPHDVADIFSDPKPTPY